MKYFKHLDIYGLTFNFTTFQSLYFKTFVGGLLSIISVSLMFIFCFLFGKDFFFKQNPKVLISNEKPTTYQIFNLTQNDLLLAWRINDLYGNEVDVSGKIYPIFYYFSIERNSVSRKIIKSTRISLEYSKCHYVSRSDLDWLSDLNNYYCVDFNNLPSGGGTENSFFYYFAIYISYCENGIEYSEDKCASLSDLSSIIEKQWEFELIYPEYYFQPNDLSKPLKISYSTYTQRLTKNLQKKDVFIFQNIQFKDDQGILFSQIKETEVMALSSHYSDYFLVEDNDLITTGQSSFIYYCEFYISKDFTQYSRSYLKLKDIIAVTGSIIKIIIVCFQVICNFYGRVERELKMVKNFIDFEKEKKPKMIKKIKIPKISNTLIINKCKPKEESIISLSVFNKSLNEKFKFLKINNMESQNNSFNSISQMKLNKEIFPSKTVMMNSDFPHNNNSNDLKLNGIQYEDFQNIIKNKSMFNSKIQNKLFSHINIFFYYFFGKFDCLFKNKKYIIYKMAQKYIKKMFDIEYYMQMIKELKFLEKIILQEEHRKCALQFLKNPNINNEEELNGFYGFISQEQELIGVEQIVNKFKEIHNIEYGFTNEKKMSLNIIINDIDNKIIDNLNNEIQKKIEENF